MRDGERWVFIDGDDAGPGSRRWDLASAAHAFVPLGAGGDRCAERPRTLADGYGLDAAQQSELSPLIPAHVRGVHDLLLDGARTGRQPWARLHAEGHGVPWGAAARLERPR